MTFQPDKITKEDVIKAINDIESGKIGIRPSTKFDVLYLGKTYPPKDVMRQAHKYATGIYEWIPGGGEPTNKYLKALGFEIVTKDLDKFTWVETHFELVDFLSKMQNKQLELIGLLQSVGITEFTDKDFSNNNIPLTEIDPFTFFCYIYKHGPERRLRILIDLANKLEITIPKDDLGIPSANAQKVWLFPYKANRNHNEINRLWDFFYSEFNDSITDEQFADVLQIMNVGMVKITESLFYVNPEKYFPLNGPTKPYIKEVFGIDNKFSSFSEYKAILKALRKKTNKPFYELSYEAWLWNEKRKNTNYWVFQGNPKYYDVFGALQNNTLKTWKVTTHKNEISVNDKIILWVTGENAGCYALGKVISDVGKIEMDAEETLFYKTEFDKKESRVSVEIEKNLVNDPVLWEDIKELEVFKNINVGLQGTNFSASKAEYNAIYNMVLSDYENFEKVLLEFEPTDLKSYFLLLFEILDQVNLSKGDNRMLFSYNRRKLSFSVGQRIALIIKNKNSDQFLVMTKEKIDNQSLPFAGNPPELYYTKTNTLKFNEEVKSSIFEGVTYELNRVKSSGYRNKNYNDFENAVFDPAFRAKFQGQKNKAMKNEPHLNQILFGPPGTGKTFHTINEALKIVDPIYYEHHKNDRKKLTDRFKELLIKNEDDNKGQIGFCTFHQSLSYEDFVEGIKPRASDTKNVYYEIEPGIFKRICQLADSYNSTVKVKTEGKFSWTEQQLKQASFYKLSLGNYQDPTDKPIYEFCRDNGYISIGFGKENDFTGLSESEIRKKCDELELETTAAQQMNFFIHYLKVGNYVIVSSGNKYVRAIGKVTGDYEYWEDTPIKYNHFRKVEWLVKDELIPIEEIYEKGLSQKTMYKNDEKLIKQDFFVNNGQDSLVETVRKSDEPKNFVLIMDEINRGNVSSIFGELITLIEKDKRAGCEEEIEVTLPYSKELFKVPKNVYLIGTMNTADRSIEALDTALRRRFSFIEKLPQPELIKNEGASGKVNGIVDGINMENILRNINKRLEKLIDKDHQIGHSYFLKVDDKPKLIHAFKNEIIPLLEEYFFGDYGKIGLVLGTSFVEKVNQDFEFATFEHYDSDIQSDLKEKAVFRIKNEKEWDFSTI